MKTPIELTGVEPCQKQDGGESVAKLGDWEVRSSDVKNGRVFVSDDGNQVLVKYDHDDLAMVTRTANGQMAIYTSERASRIFINEETKVISIGQ